MEKKSNFAKIKLLKLWEILTRGSDDTHPLTTNEILAQLRNYGIVCDRRTLYDDIRVLKRYGYPVKVHRGRSNQYSVNITKFSQSDCSNISEAIRAAQFLSAETKDKLLEKIAFAANLWYIE